MDEYLNDLVEENRIKFAGVRVFDVPITDLTADQLRLALVIVYEQNERINQALRGFDQMFGSPAVEVGATNEPT